MSTVLAMRLALLPEGTVLLCQGTEWMAAYAYGSFKSDTLLDAINQLLDHKWSKDAHL